MKVPYGSYDFPNTLKKLLDVCRTTIVTIHGGNIVSEAKNHALTTRKSVFSAATAPGERMLGSDRDTIVRGRVPTCFATVLLLRTFPAHPWSSLENLGMQRQD